MHPRERIKYSLSILDAKIYISLLPFPPPCHSLFSTKSPYETGITSDTAPVAASRIHVSPPVQIDAIVVVNDRLCPRLLPILCPSTPLRSEPMLLFTFTFTSAFTPRLIPEHLKSKPPLYNTCSGNRNLFILLLLLLLLHSRHVSFPLRLAMMALDITRVSVSVSQEDREEEEENKNNRKKKI